MDQGDAFLAIYKANFGNAIFKKIIWMKRTDIKTCYR